MSKNWREKTLPAIGVVLVTVLLLVWSTVSFDVFVGDPRIPRLVGNWWGGYYENSSLGRVWCLVRFESSQKRQFQMEMLSYSGSPDVFVVERSSIDPKYVHLEMKSVDTNIKIVAKQLYKGRRYFWQRLFVGRLKDFWKKNQEVAIRGKINGLGESTEFAIEPLSDERARAFLNRLVRPEENLTLSEIYSWFAVASKK